MAIKQRNLGTIGEKLQHYSPTNIGSKEKIKSEAAALTRIARAARGSMRDALSLLDQALAFGAKHTTTETDVTLTNIQESSVWDEGTEVDWV